MTTALCLLGSFVPVQSGHKALTFHFGNVSHPLYNGAKEHARYKATKNQALMWPEEGVNYASIVSFRLISAFRRRFSNLEGTLRCVLLAFLGR